MEYKLSEIVQIKYGKDHKHLSSGDIPVLGSGGLMRYANDYIYEGESVLIPRKGTLDNVQYVSGRFWTVDTLFYTIINEKIVLPKYLFYLIKNKNLSEMNVGSAVPSMTTKILYNLEFKICDINTQKKVVKILSTIDKKMELNNELIDIIQLTGQELYKEKSLNVKKHSSSNFKQIGEFAPVITGKRNASEGHPNKGKYNFFTCSQEVSRIDEYSFNSKAILIAGNGDFNVKFYDGKFDAYQRTYVLIPNDDKFFGYLYFAIKENLSNITSGQRGSVIKFITKGMIQDFKIPFLNEKNYSLFNLILEQQLILEKENEVLQKIKKILLPKLLNGEINLDNIEI